MTHGDNDVDDDDNDNENYYDYDDDDVTAADLDNALKLQFKSVLYAAV